MVELLLFVPGVTFAALSIGTTLLWRASVSRVGLLEPRIQDLEGQLSVAVSARRTADDERHSLANARDRLATQLDELERKLAISQQARNSAMAEAAEAERVASAERISVGAGEQKLRTLKDKLASVQHDLASLQVEARRFRQQRQALGIPDADSSFAPFDPERRAITRSTLQQLLLDSGSDAVVVARDDGLLALSAGETTGATRLATFAAMAADLHDSASTALCAPVSGWTLADRMFCDHLLRIEGHPLWIGLENRGAAPLFAMRAAHLKIVELPMPPPAVATSDQAVLDLDETSDPTLDAKLTEWAARWGADSATVLDVDGSPLGTTTDGQPSAIVNLRRVLNPTLRRLLRDGRSPDDVLLVARASDGAALSIRLSGTGLELRLIAVSSRSEMPERALDELVGLVRWHAHSPINESRVAS